MVLWIIHVDFSNFDWHIVDVTFKAPQNPSKTSRFVLETYLNPIKYNSNLKDDIIHFETDFTLSPLSVLHHLSFYHALLSLVSNIIHRSWIFMFFQQLKKLHWKVGNWMKKSFQFFSVQTFALCNLNFILRKVSDFISILFVLIFSLLRLSLLVYVFRVQLRVGFCNHTDSVISSKRNCWAMCREVGLSNKAEVVE